MLPDSSTIIIEVFPLQSNLKDTEKEQLCTWQFYWIAHVLPNDQCIQLPRRDKKKRKQANPKTKTKAKKQQFLLFVNCHSVV